MPGKLSPSQLRAARGLLNWSRPDLAKRTGVSEQTIHRFENNMGAPEIRTQNRIYRVLDENGIEFNNHNGVQFKPRDIEIYEGQPRFDEFYDFLYEHLKQTKGNVCIYGHDRELFAKYRKDPELHRNRMHALKKERPDYSMRILQLEGNNYRPDGTNFPEYKWQKKEYFPPTAYYVFGACVALISFEGVNPPFVILIKSAIFAEAYRKSFNLAWKLADYAPSIKQLRRKS